MSIPESVMDPTDDSIFTANLDDVTTMSKILHELHHEEQSFLVFSKQGLRLVTASEKVFQVSAFFVASAFQRYKFDEENYDQVNLRFMLKDFIECLNLLRDDPICDGDKIQLVKQETNADQIKTSLYIQYRKKEDPLRLRLENKSNYVINCEIKGFNVGNSSMFCPLAFCDDDDLAKITLNSKKLYEYVSGLDLNTSEFVTLVMTQGDTPLKFSTKSTLVGEVELEITSNEKEIIKEDLVVSDNCTFSHRYRTQFMKPALEALRSSQSMRMTCSMTGLLCIEHFHERSSVEYFMLAESRSCDDEFYIDS